MYLGIAIVVGIIAAVVASGKNRSAFGWMILCFIFPPLILILFFMSTVLPPAIVVPVSAFSSSSSSSAASANASTTVNVITTPTLQQMPEQVTLHQQHITVESGVRTCPYCAETIKLKAVYCRFCGHSIEPASIQLQTSTPSEETQQSITMQEIAIDVKSS